MHQVKYTEDIKVILPTGQIITIICNNDGGFDVTAHETESDYADDYATDSFTI